MPQGPQTPPLKTALIYDFDGTLARGNMQEVTFIPSVGMDIADFWAEADRLTRSADGDNILMYMQLMLRRARENGRPVTRQELRAHGQDVKLFDGLKSAGSSASIPSGPATASTSSTTSFPPGWRK